MALFFLPESYRMIARARIPRIDIDLSVFLTTLAVVLYDGAGHMYGSILPDGGGTNAVMSAHTGMVDAAVLDRQPMRRPGDDIFIDDMGERLRYRMTSREVVKPDAYDAATNEPNRDKITLITCTPYRLNTDCLLVYAERALLDLVTPESTVKTFVWSWWMIAVAILLFF
ncbi:MULTISPECIES: class C sortase [Corynebacterium]|uniref:class C sortase n=1 Tax=Corynebacterium TaxID=1716 RepID=UPI0008A8C007|nr:MULTISPECIES: class C sortase [Corynebacterium]MDK8242856.1 class C sortase [Corynebacterium coyleae]OHO78044.1 hypothetical protein HMPREF2736_11425 [Corynebacterium sp. HMSC036E10]